MTGREGDQSRKGYENHGEEVWTRRADGNRDEIVDGTARGYRWSVSPEGRQADHLERHSFVDGEVGHGVVVVGIHRGVEVRKVHLWDHPYRKQGRHVDGSGQKEERRYLGGCERTWRSELMVGQRASREDRVRYSEAPGRSGDHASHRYGNLAH